MSLFLDTPHLNPTYKSETESGVDNLKKDNLHYDEILHAANNYPVVSSFCCKHSSSEFLASEGITCLPVFCDDVNKGSVIRSIVISIDRVLKQ